ncbi:MAG TPA: zinc-binding dehydrogenase [Thermoplasmata archaeon]|nr:zinc-binding dehydrogenase [Thermoplasmata archaeon]
MRGFGFAEHGGLDRLAYVEVPEPVAGPGEVRVRVGASAFNRLDRFTLAGIPGVPVERPHVLGSDGAGSVDAVGDGVTGWSPGDRVLLNPGLWDGTCDECRAGREALCRSFRIVGEHTQGTAAPYVVVPARNVHRLPAGWSFAQGAAVPLVFQTAWRALASVGEVAAGERVAIVGAGGGVPTAAVQVAKLLGARVVVAARGTAKEARVRALGADDFVTFDEEHPLDRVLWQWSEKRGVDVIFDSVGTPTVPRSLKAIGRGGRIVVIGATAGPVAEVDLRTLFWRQASIRGSTMANAAEFATVLGHLAAGRLRPVIDTAFPFDRAAEAFRRFDAPELFGKIVLELPAP